MLKLIILAMFFSQFVIQINSKNFFLYLCFNLFKVQEDDITMIIKLAVVFLKYFISLDVLTESKFHYFIISGVFFQSNNIKLGESGSNHLRSLSQDSIT